MASLPSLSLRRPVATLMAYLILLVVGVVSFRALPVDLLPRIEFTQLTVRVRYPNVGPQEIEQIITNRIENVVAGLPGLERVNSQSEEGMSRVRLDFTRGTNLDEAANDLRAALDRVRDDLPIEAEPPEILKLDLDNIEVVGLVATSTRHLEELTRILEREISRRFKQIPGVGSIELTGGVYRQIKVDLHRDRLKAAGLTSLDVQQALARENITVPGGNVKAGMSDLYVRPLAEYHTRAEIERTVITTVEGRPIRVGDVAEVIDGYQDVRYLAEVNGVPSVTIAIQKQSGANTVDVARRVRQEMERINAERDDVHLTISSDSSEFIRQSIDNVKQNALWGSLLALFILYLFLRSAPSTAIIGVSIPISIIACFALLYFGGLTLNQMTFGGLALGVGMMVDNAIVVLENIVRKREESGAAPEEAAAVGAGEVAGAMLASTLTTCVVFVPLVFMQSVSGALFQSLALVVIFCQACSLVVGFTVVPVLAARMLRRRPRPQPQSQPQSQKARAPGRVRQPVMARAERWYGRRLRQALGRRRSVFALTALMVVGAGALWPLIPVELAPQTDADEIDVELEMGQGTNMAVVRSYVDEIEAKVREALPPGQVEVLSTEVRGDDAEVELRLVPQDRRSMTSAQIADRLRRAVDGQIPGGEVEVSAQPGLWILRRIFSSGGGNDAIEVELRGWDIQRSDQIAAEMRRRMEGVPGLTGVRVSRREGRPEERLRLDRDRIAELGLSVRDVARAIQANVGGIEAGRLRDEGEEYPIMVRLKPDDRLTAQDLEPASLRTPAGAVVPLSAVITRERGRGPTGISRVDGQRVTYVTADLESGVAQGDAVEAVQEALAGMTLPQGYSIVFGGEYQEQQEARRDFIIAIAMAVALVYMLMAGQFERLIDPLIVMLSVPVALIGVVPALLLTGTSLNIQSVMGLVMLVGVVVSNAIVLVDTVNLLRRERAMRPAESVIEAGRLRLRPILMSTATAVLGLMPMALGFGAGAEIQAPLARVVIGGLVASTLVTLVLIPVAYVTVAEWRDRFSARREGAAPPPVEEQTPVAVLRGVP
jgi:hydrophobic/amphiphilic exporter-1 (mainly G- bacteria), HAE1 family